MLFPCIYHSGCLSSSRLVFKRHLHTYIRITLDGLTATRAHHQKVKRQRIKKRPRDEARVKRLTAGE